MSSTLRTKIAAGRSDLLRILACEGVAAMNQMAVTLGYVRTLPKKKSEAPSNFDQRLLGEMSPPIPETLPIERPQTLPSARFLRISARERLDAEAQRVYTQAPAWLDNAQVLANDYCPDPKSIRLPTRLPLIRESRLLPFLRRVLGQNRPSRQPDVVGMIKRLGQGKALRRIPKRQRHHWSAQICIVLDYSQDTQPFWDDFNHLMRLLKRWHGSFGLDVRILHNGPARQPYYRQPRGNQVYPWQTPAAGTPVLILSDLGVHDDSAEISRIWQQFAVYLKATTGEAAVLAPVAVIQHSLRLQRLFQIYEWDRHSRLRVSVPKQPAADDNHQLAEILLELLAPALLVEPALLRAVRYLLPVGQVSAAAEAQAWQHRDVRASTQGFCFANKAAMENYQARFKKLNLELCANVIKLIKIHHAGLPDAVRLAELAACQLLLPGCIELPDQQAIQLWQENIAKTCLQQPNIGSLAQWRDRHVNRQIRFVDQPTKALWALAQQEKLANGEMVDLPPGIRWEDVVFFLPHDKQPTACVLRQHGQSLLLEVLQQDAVAKNNHQIVTSLYAELSLVEAQIFVHIQDESVEQFEQGHYIQLQQFPRTIADVTQDTQIIKLHAAQERITLTSTTRPKWASAMGRDQYGLFAELTIKDARQRFRWIMPGTFVMGSPESELERRDNELAHEVTLSEGYWLADTACSQAMWQAVMNKNLSDFKQDKNNPVERVSWNNVQDFIQSLNEAIPNLNAKLPTEAQWEYACRAGTTTPFSFGENITPDQVNYNGNYPYVDGAKGENRKITVPVGSLPANPWGLYEMHGNVWEWCEDRYATYRTKKEINPMGADKGASRVLRGGSWIDCGGSARSACRSGRDPGSAYRSIGFRLALGQE